MKHLITILSVLTKMSWTHYKESGLKVVITWDHIFNVLFCIAGASLFVALVTGVFSLDIVTWISLCTFAITGGVLFVVVFVEMLIRRNY